MMGTNAKEERDRSKEQAHQDVATFLRKEATIEGAAMYDFKYEFRCGVYNSEKTQKKWNEFMSKYELSCSIPPDDCTNNCPVRVEDNVKRWLIYKNIPVEFECDGCGRDNEEYLSKLSREIYRTLWNWEDNRNPNRTKTVYNVNGYGLCELNVISMGPDTMNTILYTMLHDIAKQGYTNKTDIRREQYRSEFPRTRNEKNYLMWLVNNNHKEWCSIYEDVAESVSYLGNFVLVPKGFNPARGLDSAWMKDYWDLSLFELKHHGYRDCSYQPYEKSFIPKDFNKYINIFFLWDYVIPCENKSEYIVKSLFSEHFKAKDYQWPKQIDSHSQYMSPTRKFKDVFPQVTGKRDEIQNFLDNVNWAIHRRGIFMVAMLLLKGLKSNEKDLYDILQEKIFCKDNVYTGYQEIFNNIRKELKLGIYDENVDVSNNITSNIDAKTIIDIAEKLICHSQTESSRK